MKRIALPVGFFGLVASSPVFSDVSVIGLHNVDIVGLHNIAHALQTSWLGVDPGLAVVGILILAGTIVYRFRRAK